MVLGLEAEEKLQISQRIRELLIKKVTLLKEILSCAEKQSGLSYADNSLDYDDLLEQREICISNIKKVDIVLNGYMEKADLSNIYKEEIELLDGRIKEFLKQILVLDQENKMILAHQLKEVKLKFDNLAQGRKGAKGYSEIDKINIGGAFTDNKG
jgi:hypothetical protein